MTEPARITAHTPVTDVRADGLARVIEQLKGKASFTALLSSYLDEIQALQTAIWQIYALTIDTSESDALDQIGDLFVQPRPPSMTDAVYRRVLHGCVAARKASGGTSGLIAVMRALVGSYAFEMTEAFPASLVFEPDAATGIPADVMASTLRRGKSAGVGLQVIDVPEGDAFAFSTSMFRVISDSTGFSDETQAAGGVLVGVT